MTIEFDRVYKGKITYVALVNDEKKGAQLEVGFELTAKLNGVKEEDGLENIPTVEGYTRLHLDEQGDPECKRRAISRDVVKRITGVELDMDWDKETGWLRLAEDHPHSLVQKLTGADVLVKVREYNSKAYFDLYFPRAKPKALTMAEVKAKMKPY